MKNEIKTIHELKLVLAKSVLDDGIKDGVLSFSHSLIPENVIELAKDWYEYQQDFVGGIEFYETRAKEISKDFPKELIMATSIFVYQLLTETE